MDPAAHRLELSIKALQEKPAAEKSAPKKNNNNAKKVEIPEEETGFTLGDIIGDELKDQK